MTKYLFNEGIVWEDRRKGSYLLPYIILFILLAVIAIMIWLTAPIAAFIPLLPLILPAWLISPDLLTRILVSAVSGAVALIILISGLVDLNRPRLYLTPRRLCLMAGLGSYKEVRFDKIDAIQVKKHTIIISAGGTKVIRFGPIADPYATRNAIVGLITFEMKPPEDETIVFDKAVPILKEDDDVFDADVVSS
ncbi:MAG: hypothetical protein PHF01_01585 [Methanocorpusculum sp.]|jgi:hypothetical protein|uniref:hypothetical protein n=1 Tax=Methanocorpusculum sp. TaxID=2058474 RepID=UPI002A5054A5|nr:hypothetical protein [Methanocorpusculum sp.]MDD4423233.1 hypothetical protein [Methanocorpusculum parvum]MDD2248356.1 hypothetical protein [Methanocorpusculum sp.]MDD3046875.1 hypothetical protein [Methanocorpusculum sp.]MDD3912180.1 hypothetical protein [Methanocorpusculum sp.]MDY3202068.1 hypothetical protein [Methanocorpusculum sp.]